MRQLKKRCLILLLTSVCLLLSSCGLPGLNDMTDANSISISAKTTTETQIMAYIIKGMIEHYTDYRTNIINNMGSTNMEHQAMLQGDVDISSARYTGTDLSGTLMMDPVTDPQKALAIVQKEFTKRFDQTWFPSYGFANTYAFMVTRETAEKHQLQKISDFKPVASQLTVGVDSSWMKRKGDGYAAFVDTYNVHFKQTFPMQIGLVYDAVAADKVDVVLGYSTDGRISSYDLVVLEDDLHFFPPYDSSPVVRNDALKKYPELKAILLKLAGQFSTETMQQLNYQADNDLLEPETVAMNFLRKNHFFSSKGGK